MNVIAHENSELLLVESVPVCSVGLSPNIIERNQAPESETRSRVGRTLRRFKTVVALEQERFGFVVAALDGQAFA